MLVLVSAVVVLSINLVNCHTANKLYLYRLISWKKWIQYFIIIMFQLNNNKGQSCKINMVAVSPDVATSSIMQ